MKGYFTTEVDKEFCGRLFKKGEKYYIVEETESRIIVRGNRHVKNQLMTKLWLKNGLFDFLTFHGER